MRLLIRWLRRFAVLGLGIVGVWFIVFVLRITDRRLPTILGAEPDLEKAADLIREREPLPASNAPYYLAPDWETRQR